MGKPGDETIYDTQYRHLTDIRTDLVDQRRSLHQLSVTETPPSLQHLPGTVCQQDLRLHLIVSSATLNRSLLLRQ